jgi:hypothetical protein
VSVTRRIRRQQRRALFDREFALVGPDETVLNVPGAGAIFISAAAGYTLVEAVAYSGPGVEVRKARLEAVARAAGLGDAIAAAKRRATEAA